MSEQGSQLAVTPQDDGWTIEGEIDAHTAPKLAASLAERPDADELVADVAGVSFLDSSGLRVLVEATRAATEAGRELVIARPSAAIRRVVEISGLTSTLHLRD